MPETAPKRVVFIGAECTGKSTLATAVAAHFGEPISSEYVRDHVESLDRELQHEDLDLIAKGQIKYEDEAAAKAGKWVFHDTNLLSSILYAEHYFNTHIDWVDEAFANRIYDRYFLCEPDFPWQADPGQREGPEIRTQLQVLFRNILENFNIPYVSLSGTIDQRKQRVIDQLNLLN